MSDEKPRRGAEFVLLAVLVAAILVSTFATATNSSRIAPGLGAPVDAESTSLYCTGFTGSRGPAPADVVFSNTTEHDRHVDIHVVTTTGASIDHHFTVPALGTFTVRAANLTGSRSFVGVSAVVLGGGVSASAHGLMAGTHVSPCVSSGQSSWSAAGMSTKVNWRAVVTLLNPTARPTTLNLTALTPAGFSAPSIFQGLVVSAHSEVALDLGTQIVNLANVAPMVSVVRGSIVASAVETWSRHGQGASLVAGWSGPSTSNWYPAVPTNGSSSATLALANPSSQPAHVTVDVTLAPFQVTPFTVDVGAGTVTTLAISPTSRIPPAGAASLHVTSTVPVVSTMLLQIDNETGLWPVSPSVPATAQVVENVSGSGYVDGAFANVTDSNENITAVSHGPAATGPSSSQSFQVPAHGVLALTASELATWAHGFAVITSSGSVTVAVTDAGQRAGVGIIGGSGGR